MAKELQNNRETSMRLAIPAWSGQVSTLFDFAHYLLWVGLGKCASLCQGVDPEAGGIGQRDVFFVVAVGELL
jgi:hypothetical protein